MKKILFALLLPLAVSAQKNYPAELDNYLQAQSSVKGFTGSVLVAQKGKIILSKGYGDANREEHIANTPQTKFGIGSMTKQFTAACILQLQEKGKLSVDDKLSKFFPAFPKADSVTLRMMLNHTSGLGNYTDAPEFASVAALSLSRDSMIAFITRMPYLFPPGAKFSYSNSNYFLLACILEKVSGMSYESYLQAHIFNKLGMRNSGVDKNNTVLPLHAKGYEKDKNNIVPATYMSLDWALGAGALYSTTEDLYKWDRALYSNAILSAASRQQMFTPAKDNYGFGFVIDSLEGHLRIQHDGGIPGFLSDIQRFPNDDVCVIVLSNTGIILGNTLPIADVVADGLSGIVFDKPVETPYVHKEVAIDTALLDRYVGKYKAFLVLEVIKKNGKLYRHRDKGTDIELKPESNTKFFYADDSDRQLDFEVDSAGKVTKIWFVNNEQRGEMQKL